MSAYLLQSLQPLNHIMIDTTHNLCARTIVSHFLQLASDLHEFLDHLKLSFRGGLFQNLPSYPKANLHQGKGNLSSVRLRVSQTTTHLIPP